MITGVTIELCSVLSESDVGLIIKVPLTSLYLEFYNVALIVLRAD